MTAHSLPEVSVHSDRSTNWLAIVLFAALMVPLFVMGMQGQRGWSWAVVLPVGIGVCGLALAVIIGSSLRTLVSSRGVAVRFGVWGWPRFRYDIERIARAEVATLPSSAWGVGVWWTSRCGLVLTLRSGPALRLTLTNGRRVTVGMPDPEGAVRVITAAKSRAADD